MSNLLSKIFWRILSATCFQICNKKFDCDDTLSYRLFAREYGKVNETANYSDIKVINEFFKLQAEFYQLKNRISVLLCNTYQIANCVQTYHPWTRHFFKTMKIIITFLSESRNQSYFG